VQQRTIGNVTVSAIGLGGMPMSIEGRPDRERSIATIHASLDAGVTFIDTADAYHRDANEVGHNEELIAEALKSHAAGKDVLVATKGGHLRPGDGSWTQNGHPDYLKDAARASAKRLGVESIGLYQFHRPDPEVPYAESIGALKELLDGRLVSVQNQFSPAFLSSRDELRHCAEIGVAFLPWSPFGGIKKAGDFGSDHSAFQEVADARGVSPHQVALAWHLAQAPVVVPIPGASRPESAKNSAEAADLELTDDELKTIESGLDV
jgi:aryl-alcohol dehydrogenase-like predicted oxidoreductase